MSNSITAMTLEQVRDMLKSIANGPVHSGSIQGIDKREWASFGQLCTADAAIMANAITAHLAAEAKSVPAAYSYFASDPSSDEFSRFSTLEEAVAHAQHLLEYASDEAEDSGWISDTPEICYGIVLGVCEEESREPAPEDSEWDEIVAYRLTEPEPKPQPAAVSVPKEKLMKLIADSQHKTGFWWAEKIAKLIFEHDNKEVSRD